MWGRIHFPHRSTWFVRPSGDLREERLVTGLWAVGCGLCDWLGKKQHFFGFRNDLTIY